MNVRPRIRYPEVVEDARKLMQAGADAELILVFLRDRGLDMADCIYSVQDLFRNQFSEAKNLVVLSQAWSDRYESDTQLRESAREALRRLAASNAPDLPRISFEEDDDKG